MISSDQFPFNQSIIWRPTPEYIENANLTQFMSQHGIADYDELIRRSAEDVAWYTDAFLKYLDIEFYEPYTQVVDLSGGIQWPKWCLGGKLNIVHNCLDKYVGTPTENKIAYIEIKDPDQFWKISRYAVVEIKN